VILAVASGKGGTGKTMVAVALALAAPGPVRFLDADVEEPNAHLFLRPEIHAREPVGIPVPRVDESKCNACGECGRIPYDRAFTEAQIRGKTVVEGGDGPAAEGLRRIWENLHRGMP